MSLLLIAAALVSAGPLGEVGDALAISLIVILNVVVAVVQEEKAATALDALRSAAAPSATVIRDGRSEVIPAAEVVPGDVVLIAAGDRVAADLWLTQSWAVEADESMLTGESLPVAKNPQVEADMTMPQADRTWIVYAGTLITAGTGRGLVLATGPNTAVGKLAEHLRAESPATPLQKQLGKLSARLGQAAVVVAAAVFVLTLFRFGTGPGAVEEAFLAAVALAVAAVPEGLPAVVTLSLALSVRRMARHGAIVRNLPAVETLGSTTVLLTDKTGTLTQNRMKFDSVIPIGNGRIEPVRATGPIGDAVLRIAALCSDADIDPPIGDAVEVALLEPFPPAEIHRHSFDSHADSEPAIRLESKDDEHAPRCSGRIRVVDQGSPGASCGTVDPVHDWGRSHRPAHCRSSRRGSGSRSGISPCAADGYWHLLGVNWIWSLTTSPPRNRTCSRWPGGPGGSASTGGRGDRREGDGGWRPSGDGDR